MYLFQKKYVTIIKTYTSTFMHHFIYRARRTLANWIYPTDVPREEKLGRAVRRYRNTIDTDVMPEYGGAATDGLGGLQLSVHRADAGFVIRMFERESEYNQNKQSRNTGPSLHIVNDSDDFGLSLSRIITMHCLVR